MRCRSWHLAARVLVWTFACCHVAMECSHSLCPRTTFSSLYQSEGQCRFGIPWRLSAVSVVAIRHSRGGISAFAVALEFPPLLWWHFRHSHGGISAIPVVAFPPFLWWRFLWWHSAIPFAAFGRPWPPTCCVLFCQLIVLALKLRAHMSLFFLYSGQAGAATAAVLGVVVRRVPVVHGDDGGVAVHDDNGDGVSARFLPYHCDRPRQMPSCDQ
jgi:hypothetical protein